MKHAHLPGISLVSLTLLFLAVPELVFFAGWLKPVYAVLASGPVLYCGWYLVRLWPAEPVAFRREEIYFVVPFSLALTAFAGIGGFAPQESDWIKHNAILSDCINLPWPVVITDGPEHWPLIYYLAYYLPAVVVGKIAGYQAAQVALWIWTSFGLMLSCLWFARLSRLSAPVAALALFAFCGLDFIGNLLAQILGLSIKHGPLDFYPNQTWSRIWQLTSPYWSLSWVPGQALVGWLSAGLLLSVPRALRTACFALLFTFALIWSTFACVGLGLLLFGLIRREKLAVVLKSLAPMIPLVLPVGILFAYYAAKFSPDIGSRFPRIPTDLFISFNEAPDPGRAVILLVLFVALEFGLYVGFVRARFAAGTAERELADASGLALICLLPVTVGEANDLFMRASVAPLFCLALLTARAALTPGLAPKMRRWLWVVLLIGSLTPFIQVSHQAYHVAIHRWIHPTNPSPVQAVVNMSDTNFPVCGAQYVGSTNSFFARNLAK